MKPRARISSTKTRRESEPFVEGATTPTRFRLKTQAPDSIDDFLVNRGKVM